MTLGDRIKHYRTINGFSLQDLADRLGVKKQTVSKYEKGIVTNIPLDKISEMANVFGISEAELTGWDQKYYNQESAKTKLIAKINEMTEEECGVLLKFISK